MATRKRGSNDTTASKKRACVSAAAVGSEPSVTSASAAASKSCVQAEQVISAKAAKIKAEEVSSPPLEARQRPTRAQKLPARYSNEEADDQSGAPAQQLQQKKTSTRKQTESTEQQQQHLPTTAAAAPAAADLSEGVRQRSSRTRSLPLRFKEEEGPAKVKVAAKKKKTAAKKGNAGNISEDQPQSAATAVVKMEVTPPQQAQAAAPVQAEEKPLQSISAATSSDPAQQPPAQPDKELKPTYLCKSQVLGRGWTVTMIKKFLPYPDMTKRNPIHPRYASMKLFRLSRVSQIEAKPEFIAAKGKSEGRRAAALAKSEDRKVAAEKAAEAQWAETMAIVENSNITVPVMSREALIQRVCDDYNGHGTDDEDDYLCWGYDDDDDDDDDDEDSGPLEDEDEIDYRMRIEKEKRQIQWDNIRARRRERGNFREATPASDESFLNRITFNYLEARAESYHRVLASIPPRSTACARAKERLHEDIIRVYPWLNDELKRREYEADLYASHIF